MWETRKRMTLCGGEVEIILFELADAAEQRKELLSKKVGVKVYKGRTRLCAAALARGRSYTESFLNAVSMSEFQSDIADAYSLKTRRNSHFVDGEVVSSFYVEERKPILCNWTAEGSGSWVSRAFQTAALKLSQADVDRFNRALASAGV